MILEHAILDVKAGQGPAFEEAMREALPLIAETPGFIELELRPCVEMPDRFLLLVRWDSVEAHTLGFRGSDRYEEWKRKLHHFYEPSPQVQHYGPPVAGD